MKPYYILLVAAPFSTALAVVEDLSYFSLFPRFPQGTISGSDGRCGASYKNAVCTGSGHGDCCSQKGYCGSTAAHCQEGCQSGFGTCETSNGGQSTSTSGNCGLSGGFELTCVGSEWGDCCSSGGFCGKETSYCGEGCNPLYGKCSSSGGTTPSKSTTSKAPSPSTTKVVQPTPMSTQQPDPDANPPQAEVPTSVPPTKIDTTQSPIAVVSSSSISESSTLTSSTVRTTSSKTFASTASVTISSSSSSSESFQSSSSIQPIPSSTSRSARLTATDALSSPQTASSTPTPNTPATSTGMSTGAKAGIVVGIVAIVLVIAFLAFFLIRRRRRVAKAESPPQYSDSQPITEFYDYKSTAKLEQEKGNFYEMDSRKHVSIPAAELASPVNAAEEAAAKERARIARVDDRAAAGYGGAYRGN